MPRRRMPNDLAPEAIDYHVRRSADVHEHANHISGWRQDYDQLSGGRFEGSVRELCLQGPRLQVFHEFTGQQISQRCEPWPGSIWFGIPDGQGEGPLHFSGRVQGEGESRSRAMMAARASEGVVLRTPRRFGIYGVVLDEQWLDACLEGRSLGPALPGRVGARAVALEPRRHAALCRTLESMLSLGVSGEAALPWGRRALRQLVDRLLGLLGERDGRTVPECQRADDVQRQLALVMAARNLAADPFNSGLSVEDLCQRLHLTPRTLHNHFQRTVGESPAEFLRAVRLNACRRRLRSSERGPVRVQDVAAQWGFFHMGRFSQQYKAMFGEAPSQTVRGAGRAGIPSSDDGIPPPRMRLA